MNLPYGQYCEIYGKTLRNRVLEFFLEAYFADIAVSEITDLSNISKPKAYQIIDEFIKKGFVIKSRVIGKTQMYKLNTENPIVKIYIRNFKECLNMVFEQYSKKKTSNSSARVAVSAKGI